MPPALNANALADAIALLEPEQPLVLMDAIVATDGGHTVFSCYMDIGMVKVPYRPEYLLKAIESKYGLEHASEIQLSAPGRFRDFGETMIRDEQEGQAQRNQETTKQIEADDRQNREQEEALKRLGIESVAVSATNTEFNSETQTIYFGTDSWMYCTSIAPDIDKYENWRESLPCKYDHDTPIRQPRKFAAALGSMFANQKGPHGKVDPIDHPAGIQSLQRSQVVVHGPMWYTDDVYDFLESRQDDPNYALFPQFVKHSDYRDQREYRFLIRTEEPVDGETLLLQNSGELRDALAPPQSTGTVKYQAVPIGDTPKGSLVSRTRPVRVTHTQSRRDQQQQNLTLRKENKIVLEQEVRTERTVTVTKDGPTENVNESDEVPSTSSNAELLQVETTKRTIHGVEHIEGTLSRANVFTIEDSQIEDIFTIETRDEAKQYLDAVKKPFSLLDSAETKTRQFLEEMAREAMSSKSRVQVGSSCWHAIWPIFNLVDRFGEDVIAAVGVESDRFVSIELQGSESGTGKVLVGPEGTFAYVVKLKDESRYDNGRLNRLVFFPDEIARAHFESVGWPPTYD